MRYDYSAFQGAIKNLKWDKNELAARLSSIGHESEVVGDQLDVTLTSNRKDCQDFQLLIFDLCGIYSELEQSNPPINFSHSQPIPVTIEQVNKLLGSNLDDSALSKLEKLGFIIDDKGVRAPSFRSGIETAADIAEELLRIVGFNAIEVKPLSELPSNVGSKYHQELGVKQKMVSVGLFETRTYSFNSTGTVELKNPFNAQTPFLRTSLLAGLLATAGKNPYLKRVSCFEIGNTFETEEKTTLGILLTGQKNYDVVITAINQALAVDIQFVAVPSELLEQYGVKQPNPVWAQIDIEMIPKIEASTLSDGIPVFKSISKFPPLVRDITLTGLDASSNEVINRFTATFPELLFAEHIDSYTNPTTHIRSETYRLVFQKMESSFVDDEIRAIDKRLESISSNSDNR